MLQLNMWEIALITGEKIKTNDNINDHITYCDSSNAFKIKSGKQNTRIYNLNKSKYQHVLYSSHVLHLLTYTTTCCADLVQLTSYFLFRSAIADDTAETDRIPFLISICNI